MRRIEKEEERLSFTEPDKQCFHLCIVNLGTCFLDNNISGCYAISSSSSSFPFIYCTIPLPSFILLLSLLSSSIFSYSNFEQYCYCPRLLFSYVPIYCSFLPLILPSFLPTTYLISCLLPHFHSLIPFFRTLPSSLLTSLYLPSPLHCCTYNIT
jgi:hypothetical protein